MRTSCCRPQAGSNALSPRTRRYFWGGGSFSTSQEALLGYVLCLAFTVHSRSQPVSTATGHWSGRPFSLIDCLEVRVWVFSSLSLVAPSLWKQLSVDVHNPRHMLCNWFHSDQFLPLPWMFFPSWHQSEHFKLRLHHVILLLKKKINVLDQWHDGSIYWVGQNVHLGFSLRSYRNPNEPCGQPNTCEVPREGDLLHHLHPGEDLESKSSHDGCSKPVRNKPFLLSTTKVSSVTSAKLKVN